MKTLDIVELPSPNFSPRPAGEPIDFLILHCTGMPTGEMAIERLCDPATEVSAHYVVEEDGTIYRLVPESEKAHHAGVSFWGGVQSINSRSVGIEIVNPGAQFAYTEFPKAQMDSVLALSLDILSRHPIPPEHVLGHSDVASIRRWYCPGGKFPWKYLADNGVGIWPQPTGARSGEPAETLLARYGYETGDSAVNCCSAVAFQRHYRPEKTDGILDEECHELLDSLCQQIGALEIVAGPRDVPVKHPTPNT